MITIIAMIIGYILGIAPFITPKIIELVRNRVNTSKKEEENKEQAEIFDEWLNGAKKEETPTSINQQDIYNEYITGIPSTKGE